MSRERDGKEEEEEALCTHCVSVPLNVIHTGVLLAFVYVLHKLLAFSCKKNLYIT